MKTSKIIFLVFLLGHRVGMAQNLPAAGSVPAQQTKNIVSAGLTDNTILTIQNTGTAPLRFCMNNSAVAACTGIPAGMGVNAGASANVSVAQLGGLSSGAFLNVSNTGATIGSFIVAQAPPGGNPCTTPAPDAWQLNPLQISNPDISLCGAYNNIGIGTSTPAYKLHVNGTQAVEGNLTGNGNFYLNGDQISSGNLSLNGNLTVAGGTGLSTVNAGNLTVTGTSSFTSLNASGDFTLNGNQTLTGNLSITGNASVINESDNLLVLNRPNGLGKKVQISLRREGSEAWSIGTGAISDAGNQINDFYIYGSNSNYIPFYISPSGKIGINTTSPNNNYALSVNGDIRSKRVKVETSWSDFVFNDDYPLMPLSDLEQYILSNRHLPEIPSGKEIESDGADVGELLKKQMQKIEELTLYIIQQQKEIDVLRKSINK